MSELGFDIVVSALREKGIEPVQLEKNKDGDVVNLAFIHDEDLYQLTAHASILGFSVTYNTETIQNKMFCEQGTLQRFGTATLLKELLRRQEQ